MTMPIPIAGDVQFKSILATTDFSSTSEKSLRYALAIARAYRAKLHVVHVTGWNADDTVGMHGSGISAALEDKIIVREGDVWPELQKFIRQASIDLVVIGTHGRKGLKKLVLGSVAEQVFRQVSCPVLTVGPHSPDGFQTGPQNTGLPVLLATDFCQSCAKALTHAVSFANRRETRLALLHAISPTPAVEGNRWYTAEDVFGAREATRAAVLQRLRQLLSDRALKLHPICMAEFGSPAERILWTAEQLKAEAIIMGLQGRGFDEEHLSWATAYEVVCSARCPVFTIRTGI